jgi:hypothetical protein
VMSSFTSLSHLLHLAVLELVLVLFLLLLLQTRVLRYQWLHLPFRISNFIRLSFVSFLLFVSFLFSIVYCLLSVVFFLFFALLVVLTLLCASRKYCWNWDYLFLYYLHWWNNFGNKWLSY